jgi:hypothetical protein
MVENKLAAGYTPMQVGAFVMLLSQAEQQPQRGRFRSLVELRAAMDCMVEKAGKAAGMSKFVPFLLERGDVVKLADGRYYVDGWDEWQEGNWQVAERMRRVRERKSGDASPPEGVTDLDTPAVTPAITPAVTPPVTVDVTVGVTPDVTARDARRSAAAAAPNVAAAAGGLAVGRQQQAASETAPLPLPLPPEVVRRTEELEDGCREVLARELKRPERDLVLAWASTLRRRGELVPVAEILDVVRREMTTPTPNGSLPANLAWCADSVAALARERAGPSLPRPVRDSMNYDQQLAQYAEQLRQEGR